MKSRIISLALAIFVLGNFLTACSDITSVDQNPPQGHEKITRYTLYTPSGVIRPHQLDLMTFDLDESAPAVTTLANFPSVASWRLVISSSLPHSAMVARNMHPMESKATVTGYNRRGNVVASGSVYIADYDELDTWYCTVNVSGTDLTMDAAGSLITDIVKDIERGGDGNPFAKESCWWKSLKAAGSVATSIVGGAVVLETCFVTGGILCAAAIATFIELEEGNADRLIDWYCHCIDPNASFCD